MNPDLLLEATTKTQKEVWELVKKKRMLYGNIVVDPDGHSKTYYHGHPSDRVCFVTDWGLSIFRS